MFPRVKRSELDLQAIGRELLERKTELEGELTTADADDSGESLDDDEDDSGSGRSRGGMAARDDDE
jgi:hypothetical protein